MMDEKQLEQEYRKLKHQDVPDLWNRIEANLKDHPERVSKAQSDVQKAAQKGVRKVEPGKRPVYGMAAAAAAVLVLVIAAPQLKTKNLTEEGIDAVGEAEMAYDRGEVSAEKKAENAAPAETAAGPGQVSPGAGQVSPGAGSSQMTSGASRVLPEGVLAYDQLQLAAWQPTKIPAQAVTVPEDSQYFSEAILGDTELLCGGTVTSVSFEQDTSGTAVKVVYEMTLDQVYYSTDYTTGMDTVTVKSPIIQTEGDEVYILYQLQPGGTYLLPLREQDGGWELLYPFAPQIQVTGDGAYLFHSGYASLVNDDTSVVIGSQEGENDYYYDRMLLRQDDDFLSDFVSLVESQAQGRNQK